MLKTSKHNTLIIALFSLLLIFTLGCNNGSYQTKETNSTTIFIDSSYKGKNSVVDYITPYKDSIDAQMYQVIGHAARTLDKDLPEGLLTNFISDLILDETRLISSEKNLLTPDMALMNHKGLRTIIEEGPITVNKIFQLMPFENEVVLVKLTKDQTLEFLNYVASQGGDGVAGASFTIKDEKATGIKINGKPFNKEYYVVATSDYLSKGGDHYDVFKKGTIIETKVKLRDMIINHIKKLEANNEKANSQLDNRIKL
ncbi:5'-nucleotidase C-terminal domain-containing protein [Carboxylicivirga linearis]|uniref:5'-nucleotidase C-terminal domain-containing protein n=1 Tax=Carboxylicivirga linearis TaxID=1628157 RepID=A0ABS5JVV6_9BACT|nr:5'-nucleotidase [Carboxylicivirga linearis]MBS2099027.1 5'-nucleotidase C-terminal domain-containing protein [Carboxylicivirga linearis]